MIITLVTNRKELISVTNTRLGTRFIEFKDQDGNLLGTLTGDELNLQLSYYKFSIKDDYSKDKES